MEYNMQGQLLFAPYQLVYWTVYNTPDFTGAQSGYSGQLQNIVIASQYNIPPDLQLDPVSQDLYGYLPAPFVGGLRGIPINSITPIDGQVLTYDATDGYWVPKVGGGSGGIAQKAVVISGQGEGHTFDYTVPNDANYLVICVSVSGESNFINLPSSPADAQIITIKLGDENGTSGSFDVNGNGQLMDGQSSFEGIGGTTYPSFMVQYSTALGAWSVLSDYNAF